MARKIARQGTGGPELPHGMLMRIGALMAQNGVTRQVLSRKAGLGDTYISDLLSGKNTKPSIPAMASIAKVLGTTVANLLGESYDDRDGDRLRVANLMPLVGVVETGTLRKLPQGEPTLVMRPRSEHHPLAKHFALYVNDDSMSAAREQPILPGMEVVCIDIADADLAVETGKIYAIRRTHNGQDYETILRRARVYRDRVELTAEGGKLSQEKIIHRGQLTSDRSEAMYAFGLVCGSYHSFE